MKKFLGVFNTNKITPEQIYEEVIKSLKKKEEKVELIKESKRE